MEAGSRGTFVIPWAQTEIDGVWSAPIGTLRVGATWAWAGEALRLDGPSGILPLGPGAPAGDDGPGLRRVAARNVRRLLHAAERGELPQAAAPALPAEGEPPENSFTVTDGRSAWVVTLIPVGGGRPPLCLFAGTVPPRQTDLWVVRHDLDLARRDLAADAPGGVICFTPGTLILTECGPLPVEAVGEGMRLQTKDNGLAEVLWSGRRRISGARLHAMPQLAPIRLREGALDRGVPDAGLLVSPDHRLVLKGPRARALFNCEEVLVAARDLVDDAAVTVDRGLREVTYIHLLLPRHEIVFANGVESESFHPASAGPGTLEDGALAEMLARLPGPARDPATYGAFARRVLSRAEAAILAHDGGRRAA